jgi:hypothetical protein
MEFYLQRLVDTTREHADSMLATKSDLETRLHESTQSLRLPDNPSIPCYVIARQRELDWGNFPEPRWTRLCQEGDFVLLCLNRDFRRNLEKRSDP